MKMFALVCAGILIALCIAEVAPVSAQRLTITPGLQQASGLPSTISGAVRSAPDYATQVLGDPWDFEQASDYVYMFSVDDSPPCLSTWKSMPTMVDGHFVGVSRVQYPRVQLLYEGIYGALNVVGRSGVRYPIDSSRFKRLSFRMRRTRMPEDGVQALWLTEPTRAAGTIGGQMVGTRGYDWISHRYPNQSPPAEQGSTGWHIYKIDLDQTHARTWGVPWASTPIRGLRLDLGNSSDMIDATIELDWVRLTERGATTADLSFTGFGGPVSVAARHTETGDVIQIYPDDGTTSTTFPDNSTFKWDYGFLPPGTWTVTASANGKSVLTSLTIDPAPYIEIIEPDEKGGRDYGRTVVGDAYDMTNPEDVNRDGCTLQLTGITFGETGLTAVTTGTSGTNCPGDPCPDPFVNLLDDSTRRPGMERTIDASTYRHLTFTIEHDRKDLGFYPALTREFGSIVRVIWRAAGKNGGPLTNTQDLFVLDGGPQTYSMDLGSFRDFGECAACTLEPTEGRDLWQGPISVLRFDPYESDTPRWFRLADVRIAADDEPNGNGFFPIRWQVRDATFSREVAGSSPAGSDATVSLYYDTDADGSSGQVFIATVPATQGIYNWNVANLPVGRYYIYAAANDKAGNSQSRYSSGPVRIASVYPAPTDSSGTGMPDAWRERYKVTDPNADPDDDGVPNRVEYQQGTNPLVSNTWVLAEGSTGFFTERIALVNPDPSPAEVTLTFLRKTEPGKPVPVPIVRDYTVLGYGRLTVNVNQIAGLSSEDFSTVVTSRVGGVLPERTMFWGDQWYGGHTGKAVQRARTQWYLAEGNAGFFSTWILLANANDRKATVQIRYLLPGGGTIDQTYSVDPNSRNTVWANSVPGLAGKSFSSDISSNVPITVERAMYFGEHPFWTGGHVVAAVESPATEWFVAEGRTGPFFDTFLLLANPNPSPANVSVRYLMPEGNCRDAAYTLKPFSREDLWLNSILENEYGIKDTDVSARITSTNGVPIIVERAMYWPKPWSESHCSAGVTSAGTLWALAEGQLGSNLTFDTYVLFANPSSSDAIVKTTVLRPTGIPSQMSFVVGANSRMTFQASMLGVQPNEEFGLLAESLNGAPIVVERSMYWNGGGQFWGAGTNETGFRLR